MAAVSAAESQKSRRTFEVGLDFISRCSKADYLYYRGMEIRDSRAVTVLATDKVIYGK